jgi:acyl carrier protein
MEGKKTLNEFIEKFKDALDIKGEFDINVELEEFEEWDSMGYISIMSMLDEEYGKEVNANQLKACKILADLYELVSK